MSKFALLTIGLCLIAQAVFAQPTGGGPGGGGAPVPLSGIELLLGAGALLGSGKLLINRLRKKD